MPLIVSSITTVGHRSTTDCTYGGLFFRVRNGCPFHKTRQNGGGGRNQEDPSLRLSPTRALLLLLLLLLLSLSLSLSLSSRLKGRISPLYKGHYISSLFITTHQTVPPGKLYVRWGSKYLSVCEVPRSRSTLAAPCRSASAHTRQTFLRM